MQLSLSIHALREEGDRMFLLPCCSKRGFLSTPSARRATLSMIAHSSRCTSFYPRPPRGGRRHDAFCLVKPADLSIHALREEGDHNTQFSTLISAFFLSTPSARRATAKTERKPSAFVSLYTSLHKLQRDVCKPNRKITPLLAQTAGIPVRSVPENHVCCRFALAGHQKISTLSWANSGCSPTCSTFVW